MALRGDLPAHRMRVLLEAADFEQIESSTENGLVTLIAVRWRRKRDLERVQPGRAQARLSARLRDLVAPPRRSDGSGRLRE